MKKTLFILGLLFCSVILFAEEKVVNALNGMNEPMKLTVIYQEIENYDGLILSFKNEGETFGIGVNKDTLPLYKIICSKFKEWAAVAHKEKMQGVSKQIFPDDKTVWIPGWMFFNNNYRLDKGCRSESNFFFFVSKTGDCRLVVGIHYGMSIGRAQREAGWNQLYVIPEKEIDAYMAAISEQFYDSEKSAVDKKHSQLDLLK